jgi:hypothetical protein
MAVGRAAIIRNQRAMHSIQGALCVRLCKGSVNPSRGLPSGQIFGNDCRLGTRWDTWQVWGIWPISCSAPSRTLWLFATPARKSRASLRGPLPCAGATKPCIGPIGMAIARALNFALVRAIVSQIAARDKKVHKHDGFKVYGARAMNAPSVMPARGYRMAGLARLCSPPVEWGRVVGAALRH